MALLRVYKKGQLVKTLELDSSKEFIAGRAKECDVQLEDHVFSRQHFKIYFSNSRWCVQSLSKYSKITFNGTEIDFFEINDKDTFYSFDYRFELEDIKVEAPVIEEPIVEPESITPAQDTPIIFEEISSQDKGSDDSFETDDKTFVPEMASNDWSYGVPFLIIKSRSAKTRTMRLEGDYWTIGREDSCDVSLDEPKASREHFEIYLKNNTYYITDLGSSNGTYLNNKKLAEKKEKALKSGDTIQVGQTLIIFEIRDPLFDDKITTLPVEMNNYPVDMGYTEEPLELQQKVIRLSSNSSLPIKKSNPLPIVIIVVILAFVYVMNEETTDQTTQTASTAQDPAKMTPFDALSKEQKEYVEKSYKLAKTLYTQGKYELALTEIEKVAQLLPEYKDAKEIAQFSKNAIDTLLEQNEIAKEEEDQKQQRLKVQQIVSQCEATYMANRNSAQLETCLEPALEIDPENAKAAAVLAVADQDNIRKEAQQERKSQVKAQIDKRKNIYYKAEQLKAGGKILDAIYTYERHIASTLPDPENLESKSKQQVQSLKSKISDETKKLSEEAAQAYSKKDYKQAIKKVVEAIKLNPQDQALKDQQNEYSKELYKIVKALYADSVLEENLGNIDSAKEKWKKIRELDVEYGDYYKKASSKIRKYGM